MKYDYKFLENRIKFLAMDILTGDLQYTCGSPAETVSTYGAYVLDVLIKSAPRNRTPEVDEKIEKMKFCRQTFLDFLDHCYCNGAVDEKLQENIKKTFDIIGDYYFDLFDIYSLRYGN